MELSFLKLSCFFDDLTDVGNLISGSSGFSKSSLNIWNFTVRVPLKPGLENFDPSLPVSVQESLVEAWEGGGLLQGWGHCLHGTF